MSQKPQVQIHCALYLNNGPIFVHAEPGDENKMAEWLLKVMEHNGVAVFKNEDGTIKSAVRGAAILGFGFEEIPFDSEMKDIQNFHKRRLIAETEYVEQQLKNMKNMSSGDEWKNGD